MAIKYAGITFGDAIEDVTFASAVSTGKTIEITYDDAAIPQPMGLNMNQLRDHVMRILAAMDQTTFPAA